MSRGSINRRVEVADELVQSHGTRHASWCSWRVDHERLASESNVKEVNNESVVRAVGERGGVLVVRSVGRRVLGESVVAKEQVGSNDVVGLILINHLEITSGWALSTDAVAWWRNCESSRVDSLDGSLHKHIAIAVSELAEDDTVEPVDTLSCAGAGESQGHAIGTKPASDS